MWRAPVPRKIPQFSDKVKAKIDRGLRNPTRATPLEACHADLPYRKSSSVLSQMHLMSTSSHLRLRNVDFGAEVVYIPGEKRRKVGPFRWRVLDFSQPKHVSCRVSLGAQTRACDATGQRRASIPGALFWGHRRPFPWQLRRSKRRPMAAWGQGLSPAWRSSFGLVHRSC